MSILKALDMADNFVCDDDDVDKRRGACRIRAIRNRAVMHHCYKRELIKNRRLQSFQRCCHQ